MTVATAVQAAHRELRLRAYAAYNSPDIEGLVALVALVSDGVNCPDDDAVRLYGKDEARADWTEQWARTRTHREPAAFGERNDGRTAVQISQVVLA